MMKISNDDYGYHDNDNDYKDDYGDNEDDDEDGDSEDDEETKNHFICCYRLPRQC